MQHTFERLYTTATLYPCGAGKKPIELTIMHGDNVDGHLKQDVLKTQHGIDTDFGVSKYWIMEEDFKHSNGFCFYLCFDDKHMGKHAFTEVNNFIRINDETTYGYVLHVHEEEPDDIDELIEAYKEYKANLG